MAFSSPPARTRSLSRCPSPVVEMHRSPGVAFLSTHTHGCPQALVTRLNLHPTIIISLGWSCLRAQLVGVLWVNIRSSRHHHLQSSLIASASLSLCGAQVYTCPRRKARYQACRILVKVPVLTRAENSKEYQYHAE